MERNIKVLKILNLAIYLVIVLFGLLFAMLYLFRSEFMPYHEIAVGKSWMGIEVEFQVLILALMRVCGGGWLATSVSILLLLLFPYRKGEFWASPAILIVGLSSLVPSLLATLMVKTSTPANPPWIYASIAILLLIISFCLSLIVKSKTKLLK